MNSFQGDPAIFIDEQGADMVFESGQPIMDAGLENTVIISLFTKTGWFGNVFTKEESKKIGSDYQQSVLEPITLSSLNNVENAAERALDWLTKKGIGNVRVEVNNPSLSITNTLVQIQPPGSDVRELLVSSNGLNWKAQAINPAHGEL